MQMPEISKLRFKIDKLEAMGKPVMNMFDMLVMNTVSLQKTGLDTVYKRLFDPRFFCVS